MKPKLDMEKPMNNPDDHGKRSFYFPGAMLDEMRSEAKRLDRGRMIVEAGQRGSRVQIQLPGS
jgi:hypothetical protein